MEPNYKASQRFCHSAGNPSRVRASPGLTTVDRHGTVRRFFSSGSVLNRYIDAHGAILTDVRFADAAFPAVPVRHQLRLGVRFPFDVPFYEEMSVHAV